MAGILSPYLSGVISRRGFFILFITATALWTELWKTPAENDAYFTHGIGNLRDREHLPHCSENEFVVCKAEEGGLSSRQFGCS
jgi:hypothetical protein